MDLSWLYSLKNCFVGIKLFCFLRQKAETFRTCLKINFMKPHKVSAHSDKFYLHFFLLVVWLSRNFVSFHKIHFKTAPTASTQALANCKIIHLENWAAEKEDFFFFVRIKVIPNTFLITSLYTYSFGHALCARIIRKCSCVHCTSYSSLTYYCRMCLWLISLFNIMTTFISEGK